MSQRPPAAPPAAPALKIVHALVFFGFAALAIAAASPELAQLRWALSSPYHAGAAPFWPALAGAGASAAGALVLAARLVQRREVTLFVSLSILAGLAVALTVNLSAPQGRSIEAANLALLEVARELRQQMGAALQKDAAVPADAAAWEAALARAQAQKPEARATVRDRAFRLQPWRVVRVEAEDWSGEGAAPGALGVWISADRVSFLITPVGLGSSGVPRVLADDRDRPIRLKGVFNPDMH